MAVFRSALFIVRVGDQDVGVGPSSLLQVVLSAADSAVDRLRARSRAQTVSRIMRDVAFAKAHTALPTLCLALMQNLPAEEQEQFGNQVKLLRDDTSMEEYVKVLALGLAVMNVMGQDVLEAAVNTLGTEINKD
jgi:hypothetical protein